MVTCWPVARFQCAIELKIGILRVFGAGGVLQTVKENSSYHSIVKDQLACEGKGHEGGTK